MRNILLATAACFLVASSALAGAKSYQVTGPVTELKADSVTVQKGSEKWEINKGSAAFPEDLKVGDKVTIGYSMTADKVEAKAEKLKTEKK